MDVLEAGQGQLRLYIQISVLCHCHAKEYKWDLVYV